MASQWIMFAVLILSTITVALNMYNYLEECLVNEGDKWAAVWMTVLSMGALAVGFYLLWNKFYFNNFWWSFWIGVLSLVSVAPHMWVSIDHLDSSRGKTFGIITNSVAIALLITLTGFSMKMADKPIDSLKYHMKQCNKLKEKLDNIKSSVDEAGGSSRGKGKSITVTVE